MTLAPEMHDVADVVAQVWSSFLGEDHPLLPTYVEVGTPFDAEQAWSAAVSTTGGWDATVTVELSADLAYVVTRVMMALPTDVESVDDADVADAVGELVNMIGGNIKSLMPGPSVLSLPAVAAGRAAHPSGSTEISRYDGLWRGQPVRVSVHTPAASPLA
ncbi:chemotaxis protein CheX [Nocardioides sp.]|uniref:chemotaxis protein CheX n=1 Tax=Nocardioides sp. TaxID=35761 RepID=UPI0026298029|nr:chemotaxis protein CheX [Nocardioides sp.]